MTDGEKVDADAKANEANGYPAARFQGRTVYFKRLVWEEVYGPVPEAGVVVCACVERTGIASESILGLGCERGIEFPLCSTGQPLTIGLGDAGSTVEKGTREAQMYCPQCGGNNEDSARFCATCGLDLDKDRQQRQEPGVEPAGQQTGQQPPAYQQPAQPAPVYQQQYQQPRRPAPQYYPPAPAYGAVPRIPSYMAWAIVTLILCFWPTGIVAVVYASQVGNKLTLGDYAGAKESSHKAKVWCWVTFGIAIAGIVIGIIVAVIAAAAAVTGY